MLIVYMRLASALPGGSISVTALRMGLNCKEYSSRSQGIAY
jgi:hypothetical protein